MIRCAKCKRLSKPGERTYRIVVETRKKDYYNSRDEYQGTGFETVREVQVCKECK